MQFLDLGLVPWKDTQLVYHSLAYLGREALILVGPAEPYVSIGYHQDLDADVDVEACRRMGLPIFRREVGGGAVYLDEGQVFYHLILSRKNPLASGSLGDIFTRLLRAPVAALGDLGVDAVHRPVNDIIVKETGRKISGNGAADIGNMTVVVGSLINTFDFDAMVSVLRMPSEKFRDKVHVTMRENMSTLELELGEPLGWDRIADALKTRFGEVLEPLEETRTIDPELRAKMDEIAPRYDSEEWLRKRGRRSATRRIKVREGVELLSGAWKAPGGLIRADASLKGAVLEGVELTGDFFIFPHEALEDLETALEGVEAERGAITEAAAGVITRPDVEAMGMESSDVANAILGPPRERR